MARRRLGGRDELPVLASGGPKDGDVRVRVLPQREQRVARPAAVVRVAREARGAGAAERTRGDSRIIATGLNSFGASTPRWSRIFWNSARASRRVALVEVRAAAEVRGPQRGHVAQLRPRPGPPAARSPRSARRAPVSSAARTIGSQAVFTKKSCGNRRVHLAREPLGARASRRTGRARARSSSSGVRPRDSASVRARRPLRAPGSRRTRPPTAPVRPSRGWRLPSTRGSSRGRWPAPSAPAPRARGRRRRRPPTGSRASPPRPAFRRRASTCCCMAAASPSRNATPYKHVAAVGRLELPREGLLEGGPRVRVAVEADRVLRGRAVRDARVRVEPDALARLFQRRARAGRSRVAGGQVRARDEVARVGLLPELHHLDGLVAVAEHVHVVAVRDVEPLALGHPVAQRERALRELGRRGRPRARCRR